MIFLNMSFKQKNLYNIRSSLFAVISETPTYNIRILKRFQKNFWFFIAKVARLDKLTAYLILSAYRSP